MKAKKKPMIQRRSRGFLVLFSFLYILLTTRLFWLQFVQSPTLNAMAAQQWESDNPIEAKRGMIYDRNGKELAVSASVPTLVAVPSEITDAQETAAKIAPILEMPVNEVVEILTAKRGQINVKRKLEPADADAIRGMDLDGLYFIEESKRFYPKQNLASHVLGFAGTENHGLEGIELYYDEMLTGKSGSTPLTPDPIHRNEVDPAEDGYAMYLTIDEVIQHIVERELEIAMKENNAVGASAIVMDPHTGEILAMANKPDYNPNSFGDYPAERWRNKTVSDAFEPGSTFKIVTASTGLEEHKVTEGDIFNDEGSITVNGTRINNWSWEKHPNETFKDAVRRSCNTVFVAVGQRLGKETLFRYLDRFGFGQPTGIDYPGEATGIMFGLDQVGPVELATTAFGQGPSVTPIQQIVGVSAVANGGKLMKPFLAKEFRSSDGQIIKKTEPQVQRQVISEETSRRMRDILAYVINAEDSKGSSKDYLLAGKTGTAQKPKIGGGYDADKYVASTIGFAPADKPRIALYVYIDTPQGPKGYYGGQVAAPVFKRMMEGILEYLEEPRLTAKPSQQVDMIRVPNLVGKPTTEAQKSLETNKLKPLTNAQGDKVVAQYPAADTLVAPGQAVTLYVGNSKQSNPSAVMMPNFLGKSMREVGEIAGQLGFTVNIIGSGAAYEQSAKPGDLLDLGTIITVKFKSATTP